MPSVILASQTLPPTASPDAVNDLQNKDARHSHFGHLKYDIAGMPDHLVTNLDEPVSKRSQRPVLR
jgi:hypothetical protein